MQMLAYIVVDTKNKSTAKFNSSLTLRIIYNKINRTACYVTLKLFCPILELVQIVSEFVTTHIGFVWIV